MLRDPARLRLNPWLEDGAGELTVLSAFCIVSPSLVSVEISTFEVSAIDVARDRFCNSSLDGSKKF